MSATSKLISHSLEMMSMRWFGLFVALLLSCRSTQAPVGEEPSPAQQSAVTTAEQQPSTSAEAETAAPSGPVPAQGVTCHEPDLQAYSGIVERQGANFALRTGERLIPLWEISQQEATAPRSPDLSAQVDQEIVICGDFGGSALYRARPVPQNAQP